MAIVLPHGVLFRVAAEGKIRQHLLENSAIDTVIGLPANLFHGTSIPVCLLVLKSKRNGNSGNILFIDASKEFTSGKNQNTLEDKHIEKIVKNAADKNRRKCLDSCCFYPCAFSQSCVACHKRARAALSCNSALAWAGRLRLQYRPLAASAALAQCTLVVAPLAGESKNSFSRGKNARRSAAKAGRSCKPLSATRVDTAPGCRL